MLQTVEHTKLECYVNILSMILTTEIKPIEAYSSYSTIYECNRMFFLSFEFNNFIGGRSNHPYLRWQLITYSLELTWVIRELAWLNVFKIGVDKYNDRKYQKVNEGYFL